MKCKISYCNLNPDPSLLENDSVKWLYQPQIKEQPNKSAKSGSLGADKPLVGQTDTQLDLQMIGSCNNSLNRSMRNGRTSQLYL